jgi:predicted DNA-binding transcriptional regulator AlpA
MPKTPKPTKSEQAAEQLDALLGTREVEVVTGYTRRWLFTLIRRGKFPAPDVPGSLGSSNKWRRSTIKAYLDGLTTRIHPDSTEKAAPAR